MEVLFTIIKLLPPVIPFVLYWLARKAIDKVERSDRSKRGWITRRERYNIPLKEETPVYIGSNKARRDILVNDTNGRTFTIKR